MANRRHSSTDRRRTLFATFCVATVVLAGQGTTSAAAQVRPAPAGSAAPTGEPLSRPVEELFGSRDTSGVAGRGINTATGNFSGTAVDLDLGTPLLAWSRTDNSRDARSGSLGPGWSTSLSVRLDPAAGGAEVLTDEDGRRLTFAADGNGFRTPADLDGTLSHAGDGFALAFATGTTWSFDGSGRLVQRRATGEQVDISYDGDGRPVQAHPSAGQPLTLAYDAAGRLVSATTGDGRQVTYAYAASGTLESVTGPGDTEVQRYQTDAAHRVSTVVDAEGRTVVANRYDDSGRVVHQDLPGRTVDVRYDDATGTATVTDSASAGDTRYAHDAAGHLVSQTGPGGVTVTSSYDANGRLTGVVTPTGRQLSVGYDAAGFVTSFSQAGSTTTYERDSAGRITSQTGPDGAVTRYAYDGDSRLPSTITDPTGGITRQTVADGLITKVVDPDGHATGYRWDAARRLQSVTDGTGATTSYGYDAAGHRNQVTSPTGAVTRYGFDPAGRRTSQVDPLGATTRWEYSAAGRLTREIDPLGGVTRYEYDDAGRLSASVDPVGATTRYGYGSSDQPETVTDPDGRVSHQTYDAQGRLASVTDSDGATTRYSYDAEGNQTKREEPAGSTVTERDGHGYVVAVTDPAGRTTRYTYDSAGRVVTVTDPTGAVRRTTYDAAGRVATVTDPDGGVTRYRYTPAGKQSAVIDPLGDETDNSYDDAGRLVSVTDAEGGVTRYTYDAAGHRTSITTPAGLVTRFGYDAAGHNTSVTDPRGGVTRIAYDGAGRQTSSTTPAGAVTRRGYDAAGRLLTITDPAGGVTTYAYDGTGNISGVTDPRGGVTRYAYDGGGRMTSQTDQLGRATRRTFDGSGNVTSLTGPDGKTIHAEYDADNERVREVGTDGSTIGLAYDGDGRRTSMTDATGITAYRYSPGGRLLTVTEPNGSVFTSTYDLAGRRTSLRYPDGRTVSFRYDKVGRLVGMSDPKLGTAAYQLDADGRLLKESLPHGPRLPGAAERRYDYDHGLLDRYRQGGADVIPEDVTLQRDADGRITAELGPHDLPLHRYTYDPAGRLIRATGGADADTRFGYDASGNRTQITRGNLATSLSYDAADELTGSRTSLGDLQLSSTDYRYDPSGRLVGTSTGTHTTTVSYDGFGQQKSIVSSDGLISGVRYDLSHNGDGLLASFTTSHLLGSLVVDKDTQNYAWSVEATPQILTQRADDPLGRLADADFLYGYGRTFAGKGPGGALFSHDVLGSTQTTADTLPWAQAPQYDVLGEPEPDGTQLADQPRLGYRGELALGTTVDLRARQYDTSTGRFTTPDPLELLPGRVRVDDPYGYANDDPVNQLDPSGKAPISFGAALGGLGGFFSGDLFQLLVKLLTPACPDPGNSIERHPKCFQGVLYTTRGAFNLAPSALDKDESALNTYWQMGQRERAAQAVTIHELNWNREGIWDSIKDKLGAATKISENVDWEVGPSWNSWRIDIVTDEMDIFEVKEWRDGTTAEVADQLARYIGAAATDGITFAPSVELQSWIDVFHVDTSLWQWFLGNDKVYVWGYENPAGHIYFAQGDKAPARVRAKWQMEDENSCALCIPIPIEVPVPVVA